jgi:aldose 1-epimerase
MIRRLLCILACTCAFGLPAQAKITGEPWGQMPDGTKVDLYTLTNAKGAVARITTYGTVLVSLTMPDRHGHYGNIVQGYDTLAEYLSPDKGGNYGATIGRVANRLQGNKVIVGDKTYHLTPGVMGWAKKVWTATPHDDKDPSLTLDLNSPDGDQGFPGAVHATVTYTLAGDNSLKIEYRATSDQPTVVNLTNHAFYNLGDNDDIGNYDVQILADRYTPDGPGLIPTGEIAPVKGTPFDFTKTRKLGVYLNSTTEPQIVMAHGYDENLIFNGPPGTLRFVARMHDPVSGRTVETWTTQPGLQFYTSNTAKPVTGQGGQKLGPHTAFTLETQHYPNSPNLPIFPSTEVTPDKPLHEVTVLRFSAK